MKQHFDYQIIGAGPAGLQLGYFLERCGKSYMILEREKEPGSFFTTLPRHRKLISINKIYTGYTEKEINLRWDWNSLLCRDDLSFKSYSSEYFPNADDLVLYLRDFALHHKLNIKYGVAVVSISRPDDLFEVTDRHGNIYTGTHLVLASGLSKPYLPEIPGIELCEPYATVSINPQDFKNQRVLIIGKGNSAFETAENIIHTAAVIHLISPSPIQMAWKTHFVGHLRAVNNNILDTYQLKSQNAILDASVENICRKGEVLEVTVNYSHAESEREQLFYDRVICCTGFQFDASIFDPTCRPELSIKNRFPSQTSEWESTNVKDLYFAGTLMQMRDYKKQMSGFIHGFRYNIKALFHILDKKYHHNELPCRIIDATPESMTKAIIERINQTSGLWQQPGFLCDLLFVTKTETGSEAQYYEDIPVDYVHDSEFGLTDRYFIITLEYGHIEGEDPFNINRVHREDGDRARLSKFLHPIIRQFCWNQLAAEHHIIEDIAAEWLEPIHIDPLLHFFRSQVQDSAVEGLKI